MRRLTGHEFDIDPKIGVTTEIVSMADPLRQSPQGNGNTLPLVQQVFPTMRAASGIDAEQGIVSSTQITSDPWSTDLMSEDLDRIFQDSLGGLSLYDYCLSSEQPNPVL